MITLLPSIWKRRKNLKEFLDRWLAQPEIDEIILWDNSGEYRPLDYDGRIKIINSSYNFGSYVRDIMSHLAKNDTVLVCDDDIFVEQGFVTEMLKYYEYDRMIGIWGNIFKDSYHNRMIIKGNDLSEPREVDAVVGLAYMIDRKYLFPIDHRDFKWTCYDIHLSGVLRQNYPQVKRMVVPNKLWRLTEEETDGYALNAHPNASKEKQELYERYYALPR
jgi:hypothetical protein